VWEVEVVEEGGERTVGENRIGEWKMQKLVAARFELARTFAHWDSRVLKSNALTNSATLPTIPDSSGMPNQSVVIKDRCVDPAVYHDIR
jgi:hypothetical protein